MVAKIISQCLLDPRNNRLNISSHYIHSVYRDVYLTDLSGFIWCDGSTGDQARFGIHACSVDRRSSGHLYVQTVFGGFLQTILSCFTCGLIPIGAYAHGLGQAI